MHKISEYEGIFVLLMKAQKSTTQRISPVVQINMR